MERDAHVTRAGYLASRLEFHGVIVVASFVSPSRKARAAVPRAVPDVVEVYVATPLEECERRDVKGMYAKARRGEIQQFTGVSDPYEPPVSPELVIDTRDLSVEEAARRVLEVVDASAAETATPLTAPP